MFNYVHLISFANNTHDEQDFQNWSQEIVQSSIAEAYFIAKKHHVQPMKHYYSLLVKADEIQAKNNKMLCFG